MSHMTTTHPQSTTDLVPADAAPLWVREEEGEYNVGTFPGSFVAYSDLVDNKLPKARAIAWLIHEGALTDEQAIREAAFAIVDYLDEIALAHKAQYEKYVQYRDR